MKSYLTSHDEAVTQTLLSDSEKASQEKQEKYETYILLFTKLLCKLNKQEIECWVEKPYFPPEKCLKICQEHNNLQGVAVLSRRSNRPLAAIEAYLDLLRGIPLSKLLEQIKLTHFSKRVDRESVSISFQPQFLPDTEQAWQTYRRNYLQPGHLRQFDRYLGKACDICTREELDAEDQTKGWLLILKFLQDWYENAH